MGTILQTSDYDSIRTKLGVDTNDLSNTDIDTIGLLPVAEAMIMSLVTDYAAILIAGGANKTFLQAAAVGLCAALAIPSLEVKRGQAFREEAYSESETKADWAVMQEGFMLEVRGYLLRISTHSHTRRTLFVATGPTRSGSSWPNEIAQWYARVKPHLVTWLGDQGFITNGWEVQP